MDNKALTLEGVKEALKESHSQPQETLHREVDSIDDFEHLGHDSSPLQESFISGTGDLLSGLTTASPTRDELGTVINKGVEKVATAANKVADELSSFDPLEPSPSLFDKKKMDSNLLEMGDNFPDRKEADDKLDKFLEEMSSYAPSSKHQEPPEITNKDVLGSDFKSATQNFMDSEREPIQPKKLHSSNDQLERYSDSEPEDYFKPSKYEDFPKKAELPESFGSTENVKSEAFKDLEDFERKKTPSPEPKKISPIPTPEPAKEKTPEPIIKAKTPEPIIKEKIPEPIIKEKTPEPIVKEKTPEPVKPKTPEPVKKEVIPEKPKPVETTCKKPETDQKSKKTTVIDAEAIFCKMGLVESLIYWRDPKKSGPVFGGVLLVLLALTYFSLISVVAYLSLIALTATISFRIYKNIVQAVQKTGDGHPFKDLLDLDVSLPQEKVREISEVTVAHFNAGVVELRRLFLVEDLVDSIKFGVLLWTLTYLGAWFNGMTLIIIAWVALFTLPKVYEANKTQIDANLEIVRTKLAEITAKVKAAIPIGKKAEEKKEQ